MKTLKICIALLMASSFLFSCSTSNDVVSNRSIQKRYHNKGFYHAKSKKVDKKDRREDMVELNRASMQQLPQNDLAENKQILDGNTMVDTKPFIPTTSPASAPSAKKVAKVEKKAERAMEREKKESVKSNYTYDTDILTAPESSNETNGDDLILYLILCLIPPLPIGLLYGISTEFWISLILTILFWLPGLIYAIIKVVQKLG